MRHLPSLTKTEYRRRVYVSGPYTSDPDKWVPIANLIGHYLMARGHYVFVPHTMTHDWPGLDYEAFMAVDLDIIKRWSDTLFFMAPSPGANRELLLAAGRGQLIATTRIRKTIEILSREDGNENVAITGLEF